MPLQKHLPCCLTIAGSDSGGNAGVQADLRAFHAYGVHGCTVFAALTAQNPFDVTAIHPVPSDFVAAQLDAVLGVYDIAALKTGMLPDALIIRAIGAHFADHPEIAKVIDPVMIATSGARLISDMAIAALSQEIFPQATIITPNLPEAEFLCGIKPTEESRNRDVEYARDLAGMLHENFGAAVLVKGGHGRSSSAVDVLCDEEGEFHNYSMPWISDPISTHGTGCTLSAAIAAELALGRSLPDAVAGAKNHVYHAIANSAYVGEHCGVLGFSSMV